ncbi:dienelactone hydrolase family protein [Actinomadura miaoliensis]|uniref:Dienelactone hydrolase family protein n=1 Tax=Actinomadura miaoliensis TaxID=430685 RepID=A0ABP7V6D6_9ACTN
MTVQERAVGYEHEGVALQGVLSVAADAAGKRPAVLVFHGMEGRSPVQVQFANRLTEWGYAGFSVDLFGNGEDGDVERGEQSMTEMMADRDLLRRRVLHVLDLVRALPEVDPDRVAAVGFCFGGLCVLDLARSGAELRGVASFHGVLTPPAGATPNEIRCKVIVFHGWDDPFAPPQDVVNLGRELSEAGADWQVHAYGDTMHSFMAPAADRPEAGIAYNATAARRAWSSLGSFLDEAFA